ncbi:MAG: amidohydrolase family protein [Bilophila sp.]
MKKIDAHAHVGYFGGWADVGLTAEQMVRAMDQHEIERTVISYMDTTVTEEAVRQFPSRFTGLIWVNPYEGEQALVLAERLIREQGFKGIKLHPLLNAFTANDAVVHPVMELAEQLNVPVFVHSGHPPFSLPHSIVQLAQDFPSVPVVMVHMGHGNGIYIQAALDLSKKTDNVYLETSGMPMHTKIREAYNTVGHERIFWGSDAPFHLYEVEMLRTQLCGLDDKALEKIFYTNIHTFLHLD